MQIKTFLMFDNRYHLLTVDYISGTNGTAYLCKNNELNALYIRDIAETYSFTQKIQKCMKRT